MPITPTAPLPGRNEPGFVAALELRLDQEVLRDVEYNALEVNVNAKEAATVINAAAAAASKDVAIAKEVLSTASANTSTAQAVIATDKALAAASSKSASDGVLTQTLTARDQAIAGLGAADQSQNLVLLAAGLQHALDIAGQAADWPLNVARAEALLAAVCVALDLAGVTAKQVNGGAVQLAAGTPAEPALWPTADRNTGVYFPAADAMALVTAGLERLRVDAAGNLGIGTNAPSGLLDVNDNRLRVRTAKTPATAAAAGNSGEICWDAGFVYVCTATNTWRRAALVAW